MGLVDRQDVGPLASNGLDPVSGNTIQAETSLAHGEKPKGEIVVEVPKPKESFDPQPGSQRHLLAQVDPRA